MEGADDISAEELSKFVSEQTIKESQMDVSKFVTEEVKMAEDECEAINTNVQKKVRRPPKKRTAQNLSDLNINQ